MKTIVCLALNPSIDKSSSVQHVTPEQKLYCQRPRYEPGGGSVNVARALQRLGAESTLFYLQGGLSGKLLSTLLEKERIHHHAFPIRGNIRENLIILETSTGYQFRFGMPGPEIDNAECDGFLDEVFRHGPNPDYVVASGSLPAGVPIDFYGRIARRAKETGARVIIDAPSYTLPAVLKEGVHLIKPNIREFKEFVGEEIGEEPQIRKAAQAIVHKGQSDIVVVSLGAGGAIVATKDTVEHILPPTVPVISKVGAGDSMVAGMVLALAQGRPVPEAARFSVAAGAAAVMTPGTELCTREDTERLYRDMTS